jgi:hypothetical protein
MFCPECRADYRTGFTQCSTCAVGLVDELAPEKAEPEVADVQVGAEATWRAVSAFLVHQFIATLGVFIAARLSLDFFADFVSPLGWIISARETTQILSGSHYYPMQVAMALLTGCILGRSFPRKSMYCVWILPSSFMLMILVLYRLSHTSAFDISPFSYFFGSGCEARNGCFGQLPVALFYSAVAYSVSSWFAQRLFVTGGSSEPGRVINPKRAFLVSALIWLCVVIDALFGGSIQAPNDVPVITEIVLVLTMTAFLAGGTALLTVVGSGLVDHFRSVRIQSDEDTMP